MSKKADIITAAAGIIKQYGGMKLTIRQLYYRLVAAQLIPNNLYSYQGVVKALVEARKDGRINYDDIEDRTRAIHSPYGIDNHEGPSSYFRRYYDFMADRMDRAYSMPKWWGQSKRVIVIVEKQALASVFQQITDDLEVDLVVCRGYPSLTLMHDIGRRFADTTEELEIIYFGDFDPSGADIERHVGDTLANEFSLNFNIIRKAITREQIDENHYPPAPAKESDARYEQFVADTGVAWQVELDAIEPRQLQVMIRESIEEHWDVEAAGRRKEELERRRAIIKEHMKASFNPNFERPKLDDEDGNDLPEDEQ